MIHELLRSSLAGTNALSPVGLLLAPIVGALTAFGPCSATRMGTLGALMAGTKQPHRPLLAFVGGSLLATVLVAFSITYIGVLTLQTPWLYIAIGVFAIASGLRAIWTADDPACEHHHHPRAASNAFLLGGTFGLLIQPCCTPVLFVAAGIAAVNPIYALAAIILYSLGHSLPPIAFAHWSNRASTNATLRVALSTIVGAIACACGLAYVVIA